MELEQEAVRLLESVQTMMEFEMVHAELELEKDVQLFQRTWEVSMK